MTELASLRGLVWRFNSTADVEIHRDVEFSHHRSIVVASIFSVKLSATRTRLESPSAAHSADCRRSWRSRRDCPPQGAICKTAGKMRRTERKLPSDAGLTSQGRRRGTAPRIFFWMVDNPIFCRRIRRLSSSTNTARTGGVSPQSGVGAVFERKRPAPRTAEHREESHANERAIFELCWRLLPGYLGASLIRYRCVSVRKMRSLPATAGEAMCIPSSWLTANSSYSAESATIVVLPSWLQK